MANKKISFELDINGKPIDVVIDKTLNLRQAARELTRELNRTKEGTKEFELLSSSLGDVQDKMATTNAKSRDLFASFSLIPGPIGEISSKINGVIGLMKTFTSFSLSDVKFQLKETINDFKDIAGNIGRATGLTKLWNTTVGTLTKAFQLLPISMNAASVAAKALAGAIAATGIGVLIVGISALIPKIMDWVSGTKDAEAAQKKLAAAVDLVSSRLDAQRGAIADQAEIEALRAKAAGKSEEVITGIKKKGLQDQLALDKASLTATGAFALEAAKIETNANLKKEDREKLLETLLEKKNAVSKRVYDATIALTKLDLETQIAANDKSKTNGQKALADQTKLAQDILNQKKDAINQYKDALEQQIQNEVDAEETSAEKLKPLIEKRVKSENEELDKAKKILDQQLKDKIISQEQFNVISDGIQAKRVAIDKKYENLVIKALEDDTKRKEEKKNELAEEIKDYEDFQRRLAEIRGTAITDGIEREKTERTRKYNNELADIEKDKNFIKLSETEKAEIRKALKTSLDNDIAAIDKKAKDDQKEKDKKAFDEQLRILELQGQSLLAGTTAYFENRKSILDTTMKKELDGLIQGSEEYIAVKKKYDKLYQQLDQDKLAATGKVISATLDAFAGLGNAIAGSYDEEAKTSEAAFNKRKQLQKATAIMSAASGIVQILTQPSTLPSPFDWIVKGINAASLGIATAINIRKIDQTKFEAPSAGATGGTTAAQGAPQPINVVASRASGGIITGAGTSTSDSIPARLSNGEYVVNARATSQFLPLLNSINDAGLQPRFAMGGLYKDTNSGYNVAENITNAITSSFNDRPIKTYVVGKEMSSQQQMDRNTKSRSLI